MTQNSEKPTGPDLAQGVPLQALSDNGMLLGRFDEEDVLLARRGTEVFAIGAHCTHYHGPLAEGLIAGETVRCPWHHAAFDLRTGEAVRTPAYDPVQCWNVTQRDGKVFGTAKKEQKRPSVRAEQRAVTMPRRIVIVGGGAAGFAAAEMLRRKNYQDGIAILSDDDDAPVDRPNLSKDYLAGNAPEDWVPLRPGGWYGASGIDLQLRVKVTSIDVCAREVALADGSRVAYDRLLLATGAEPVRVQVPGADQPHVFTL